MSAETRIRYLLLAATRAEDEGDAKTARLYRMMAEEAQPVYGSPVSLGMGLDE